MPKVSKLLSDGSRIENEVYLILKLVLSLLLILFTTDRQIQELKAKLLAHKEVLLTERAMVKRASELESAQQILLKLQFLTCPANASIFSRFHI